LSGNKKFDWAKAHVENIVFIPALKGRVIQSYSN
jgi:hypothetical protein